MDMAPPESMSMDARAQPADRKKLRVAYRPVNALVPYANNARTHSDEQVAQIVASISEFGFTNPILVDGENGIIAGHGRLRAALQLGMAEVPVIELVGLTEEQKRALILADNQIALNAGWDEDLLRLEVGELRDGGFDVGLIGFGEDQLARMLAEKTAGQTDPDDVPEPPAEPVTKPGDVWLLGGHVTCPKCRKRTPIEDAVRQQS